MNVETFKRGDWCVTVDRFADFSRDAVVVRIMQRSPAGGIVYGPTKTMIVTTDETAAHDLDYIWRIPVGAIELLSDALMERQPANERLTSKLEVLLEREQSRVDRLIDISVDHCTS